MISQWFTAREIAEKQLPSLPSTQPGILHRSKIEGWKSRSRNASGGGIEYHISSLPKAAQIALVDRMMERPHLLQEPSGYMRVTQPAVGKFSSEDKRNAKLIIVKMFDKFMTSTCLSISQAEKPYIDWYAKEKATGESKYFPQFVFDIYPSFSIQSLRGWRALRAKEDALEALGGRYGNRKGSGIIENAQDGELKKYIVALMLKQPHLTGGHLRDFCRERWGEVVYIADAKGNQVGKELPTVRSFERFMADWRVNHAELHLRLTNPDGHKNKYMMAVGRADAGIDRLNQLWEIDASPADVLCKDGRYSIYGIIDVWSRRVMYMTTKTAKTEGALLLIRRAILEWGVPETIRTDNGSDFTSKQFVSALLSLGIEHDITPPFSGDKKPFVERHFRTLQHSLMPVLPGYIGHSVKDRKEIESRRSFAQRIGETEERAFAVELTHVDLQVMIDRWSKDKFMHSPHGGLNGMTPFAKAQSWTLPVRRIENHRALDMLLAPVAGADGIRKVRKKGLTIDHGWFMSGNLIPFIGRDVLVRCNPEDMGVVYCFDEDGKFITEARCFEREGVNPVAAAAEMKKHQKAYEKEHIDPLRKEMRKITPARMAEAFLGQAAKDNGHLTAIPMRGDNYQTDALMEAGRAASSPMERAASDIKRAHERFDEEFLTAKENKPAVQVSDEDRWWNRATDIQRRLSAHEDVSDQDIKWLTGAKEKHWFVARESFERLKKDGLNVYAE